MRQLIILSSVLCLCVIPAKPDVVIVSGSLGFSGAVGYEANLSGPGLDVDYSTCDAPARIGFSTGFGVGGEGFAGSCLWGQGDYQGVSGDAAIVGFDGVATSCQPVVFSAGPGGGAESFSETCQASFEGTFTIGNAVPEDGMPYAGFSALVSGSFTGTGTISSGGLAFLQNGSYVPSLSSSVGGSFEGVATVDAPAGAPEPWSVLLVATGLLALAVRLCIRGAAAGI